MPRTTSAPQWAQQLLTAACKYKNYTHEIEFTWTQGKALHASGRSWAHTRKIHVTAGQSGIDTALCVLHEFAHLCTPDHDHDLTFWRCAFDLYIEFRIPAWYAIQSEVRYKKTAYTVVHERYTISHEQDCYLLGLMYGRKRPVLKYIPTSNPDHYEQFYASITGC